MAASTSQSAGGAERAVRSLPDLRTRAAVQGYLRGLAQQLGVKEDDDAMAAELDQRDCLAHLRDNFNVPRVGRLLDEEERAPDTETSAECVYLCGNSLGLQPKAARTAVTNFMDTWEERGVRGHFVGPNPWVPIEDTVMVGSARVVGAKEVEVVVMNSLTVNIHLGLVPFYQPTPQRYKVLMEEKPFPSDLYVVQSQVRWHGYDPESAIVFAKIREGESVWRDEDIVQLIEEHGDSIALVFLSGVHYATGHFFDIKAITEAGHRKGSYVGWDLAHAVGNVELALHDWGVDFACWCTYKYLNSGPGGIAGFFVHEEHAVKPELPRLVGWWAHNRDTRFQMDNVLDLQPGAKGFQLSNPPVLGCTCLQASLQVFDQTSMQQLACKSRLLTGYLELLLEAGLASRRTGLPRLEGAGPCIEIITSSNPARRGNQLTLRFNRSISAVHKYLTAHGVVVDMREPDMLRVAPAPLYNSFTDTLKFYRRLRRAMDKCS